MVHYAERVKNEIETQAKEAVDQYEDDHQLGGLASVGSFKLPEAVVLLPHQVESVAENTGRLTGPLGQTWHHLGKSTDSPLRLEQGDMWGHPLGNPRARAFSTRRFPTRP